MRSAMGGPKSLIITNARRGVKAVEEGRAPAEQWSTDFGPDDELRSAKWAINDPVLLDDPEYQNRFRATLERFINRTLRAYSLNPASWESTKALRFLGVTYRIETGQVRLTGITKLMQGLKEYQKQAKSNPLGSD